MHWGGAGGAGVASCSSKKSALSAVVGATLNWDLLLLSVEAAGRIDRESEDALCCAVKRP